MAPDLNSVPPSPYSRRNIATFTSTTDLMAPPPVPFPSSAVSSSRQQSRELSALTETHASIPAVDNTGVGVGPGPLRHPRPLTAADLHMQLEKEQEAVVNRLTRELSLLRQQSVSVASTNSSASTGLVDAADHSANHLLSGPTHPTPSRRHRSSSSLSTRSANTAATTASGLTGISGSTVGTTAGIAGSTASGIAPLRDAIASYSLNPRESLSRHDSTASSRPSETSSPSLSSSLQQSDQFPHVFTHRQSTSSQQGFIQLGPGPGIARSSILPSSASTSRYEEAAHHRSELDLAKRENDNLRRRIRELERNLSNRRQSGVARARSDSASTGVSIPPTISDSAQEQGLGGEDAEDAVNVGESAGSIGVGGGR